ncbi:MAG: amidohydrolase family protein [Pseudomonadota bacterium]
MNSSNRLRLDYAKESATFEAIEGGIIDIHSHIHGNRAAEIYARAADDYGITLTYSMTSLDEVPSVKKILGERVRFIAIPRFHSSNPRAAFGAGFIRELPAFKAHGARIAKFWNAPRIYEAADEPFATNPFRINSPSRIEAMHAVVDHGMIFMAHIGDPDTWFATKYRDARRYGTKLEQYELFSEVLERFPVPWIAAHMGGYPEDLTFLSNFLTKHPNLYLDCSATKWIVRELSKHTSLELRHFFSKWRGRLIFGSDIVTRESHLSENHAATEMDSKASNEAEAYDLYASRYWALRTLLEKPYHGESPISDPDLHLVDNKRYTPLDAPTLRGCELDSESLTALYRQTAADTLGLG